MTATHDEHDFTLRDHSARQSSRAKKRLSQSHSTILEEEDEKSTGSAGSQKTSVVADGVEEKGKDKPEEVVFTAGCSTEDPIKHGVIDETAPTPTETPSKQKVIENNNDIRPASPLAPPPESPISTPPTDPRRTSRAMSMSRQTSHDSVDHKRETSKENGRTPEEEDQKAIDQYYENNQYSVTGGMYQKNADTMNRIPANYLRAIRENQAVNRDPSISRRSGISRKSVVTLPIPGADAGRFTKSFYWLAHHHKSYGFRHLLMLIFVFSYWFIGATVFYNVEHPAEKEFVIETGQLLREKIQLMANDIKAMLSNDTVLLEGDGIEKYIKESYIEMLELEGKFTFSVFHKAASDDNYQWTFGSGFFFSSNVFTTVGYGAIAPVTKFGKSFTMVYGLLTVPLTLVVIRDLGQWALVVLTKIYARILIRWRKAQGYTTDEDEDIELPIKFCLTLLASYLVMCSLVVFFYDESQGEPGSGIDYFNAFYFSFITSSTIGLGDTMPNNATYSPLLAIMFFFGMPIMKVVNRVTYIALENGVFGTVTVLENKMENAKIGTSKPDKVHPAPGTEVTSVAGTGATSEKSRQRKMSECSRRTNMSEEEQINEFLNNFTVRSIATFMQSRGDVYGGDFGRVRINRSQLGGSKRNLDET